MASVMLAAEELRPRLQPWGPALTVAAINGPSHSIVSGETDAVAQFIEACEREGIQAAAIAADDAGHSAQIEPLREQLVAGLADLNPRPARIPLYSTVDSAVSGDALDTTTMDAQYWYANLREPVRFHDSLVGLLSGGEHTLVELSPHPLLAPAITDTLAGMSGRAGSAVITTLHRYRPDLDALAGALRRLHTHGHSPSWRGLYPHAQTVALPTYPFEHRRYWPAPARAGDAADLGLGRSEHPLLGAVTELADPDLIVLSGRLSTTTQGWLAGHMLGEAVVFPAAGFVDVVLAAGERVGCPVIGELVLQTPLVLVEHPPTDVQVTVHALEDDTRRAVTVHARPGDGAGVGWTLHASGVLSAEAPRLVAPHGAPVGVQPVDVDGFYAGLAEHGYRHGGLFRSVRGIGVDPGDPDVVYARVGLPADTEVAGYGLHPALLDAAFQAFAAGADPGEPRLPFVISGVGLHATAATVLDVELTRTGVDTFRLCAVDPAGAPVIAIDAVTMRAVPEGIGPRAPLGAGDGVFELAWSPLPDDSAAAPVPEWPEWVVLTEDPDRLPGVLRGGPIHTVCTELAGLTSCPELVMWPLPVPLEEDADPLPRLHGLTRHTLGGLQEWLARAETTADTGASRLVIVTRHAVSIGAGDRAPDMAHAAAWALIHSAQSEHPQRILVLDTDDTAATEQALLATVARWPAGEPQLVLRGGSAYLPRLTRVPALTAPPSPAVFDPQGTVLITGGTGTLGGLFAEHLVRGYGVRHLLLVSRSGPAGAGAGELHARLTGLGAQVTISACDVSDAAQLGALLEAIPARHRLSAVIHATGMLEDAVIGELTGEQLDMALAAKADAAWHLHHLTRDADLDAFVVFSSVAGVLGVAGQANYAAANAFCDALAYHRRRRQQATSLAWGYWHGTGLTAS